MELKNLYKHHLMLQFMEEKNIITSIVIVIGQIYQYEKIMPYEISKTKAEKKMWEMAKKANLDACAINPVLVLGPSMTGVLSMSNRVTIKKIFRLTIYS